MSRDPFVHRIARDLRQRRLLGPRSRVLVGLSGGLDSVVLLHALRFNLPWRPGLTAAHLDHRMRSGSTADADWVAGLCRAWDVPLVRARARTPPSGETGARDLRHAFLRSARRRVRAHHIVLAHHADDQAETVLFRLVRGTGMPGLAGIPYQRDHIVRPLLGTRRAELHDYARRHRLTWREDPSNLDLRYARNRIRHIVLPALEAAAPGATASVVRLARVVLTQENAWDDLLSRVEPDLLQAHPDGSISLARDPLLAYHPYIRARLLRRALRRYGSRPHRSGTRAALEFISTSRSGGGIDLPGGVRLEREFDRFIVRPAAAAHVPDMDRPLEIPAAQAGSGEAIIGGRRLAARWGLGPGGGHGGVVVLDANAVRFPLRVRRWQPGDRIRLSAGSMKLKKLFGARRVPRSERGRVPIVVDATGAVLWVPGVARSAVADPERAADPFHLAIEDVGAD